MQDQQEGQIHRAQKDYPEHTFQTVPSAILNDVRRGVLERGDVCVYSLLKAHARKKNSATVGYEFLAVKAACDVSTIRRALVRLENAKHIKRKQNHDGGNVLLLTDVKPKGVVFVRGDIEVEQPPHLLENKGSTIEQATDAELGFHVQDEDDEQKQNKQGTQNSDDDVPF